MLRCNHPVPPNRYDDRVVDHLRFIGFYHASQIGIVQCQKALVNALVERWHPQTHTFHLPIGECAVTLEDVTMILGLPTDGLPVTGMTISSVDTLEAECLHQFGVTPRKSECRGSGIKIGWLRDLKEHLQLTDEESKQSIVQFSWGSACLAHLYRVLCRASRFDCKEINSSLTLLLRNWERGDRRFRYMKFAEFRKAFDDLQEGQFAWVASSMDRVDPDIIPADMYMHSIVWSSTVPLESFECIEWHATDRSRRQFSFVQGVPHQQRNIDNMVCLIKLYLGEGRTPDDTEKGYNLRVDPPRRSANRFTPSMFKKAAKKCKSFVKDVKWAMRK
ncbi:serine/threonine-protein phosphatase 7 long form homolog [Arachis stenosperma]|uniref:serine/threonine-protein phosphatase 7 long form homolog n=1 Tax=Arachis stenosperma TaxID=217475 RepID=UPI0025AC831F|nr:serine/threonine-protein phosphatase 7 long form homolog [Arachis stenosperma]